MLSDVYLYAGPISESHITHTMLLPVPLIRIPACKRLQPWLIISQPEPTLCTRSLPRTQTMLVERIASEAAANLLVVTPSGVLSKWWVAAGLLSRLGTFRAPHPVSLYGNKHCPKCTVTSMTCSLQGSICVARAL